MKILLTGSSGFIGKIIKNQFDITYTLNRKDSYYNIDLCKIVPYIDNEIDLVIHNAGKAHSVPQNEKDVEEFFNVNYKGTLNLLHAITKSPPSKFVYISSVAVYGKQQGECIKENSSLLASDPYGESKKLAEGAVIEWCNRYNVKYTILRLPLVVGNNSKGNLKAMINGIEKGFYFNIKNVHSRKSMVLAEDVANYILKAADIGGIYNLTDGYHPNLNELSTLIANQLGKKIPMSLPLWLVKIIAIIGNILGDKTPINSKKLEKLTSTLTFDDTKARESFGWNPTPVLKGFKIID